MNFRTKIWLLPISAGLVFALGVLVSVFVGTRAAGQLDALSGVDAPYLEHLLRMDRAIEQFRTTVQSAAAEGDAAKLKDADDVAKTVRASVEAIAALPGEAEDAARLGESFEAYRAATTAAVSAMLQQKEATALAARMQSTHAELDKVYKAKEGEARERIASAYQRVGASLMANLWIAGGTGLAALIVLGIASRIVVRSVWRDLGGEPRGLRDLVQRVAHGDLDVETLKERGDSDSLNAAVGTMVERLSQTLASIRTATDTITTASGEIASGNQDLSSRTEHTASNLQETAASVERLTDTVQTSASSAHEASGLASTAMAAAERGGNIVTSVVSNMGEISAASRKINEIIGVIDGIAFQTNILALNAAVEAARAGEQGRGFAVVAGEVRGLAQRCATAAKEIKDLIRASGEKVESGTVLVNSAGQAMQEIMSGVQKVNAIMAEISRASSEQSEGIGQVNTAVSRLDQMTQQNAALVEQSAAASESLKEQTIRLMSAVSAFKLKATASEEAAELSLI